MGVAKGDLSKWTDKHEVGDLLAMSSYTLTLCVTYTARLRSLFDVTCTSPYVQDERELGEVIGSVK
jgi:hypothetical protein